MDRRTFIRTVGATGLGLTGRSGGAAPAESHPMLVRLLEEASRQQLPAALVERIGAGLLPEELLAALAVAAGRNVQPYPVVGFKYHAVMVLRSIHATMQHLPPAERWLPLIWAADSFKEAQAEERSASGWHMRRPAATPSDVSPGETRRALGAALDRWDHEAADAAITPCAGWADPAEIFPVLFPCAARDLRDIGHKAITVACAHSLVTRLGAGEAAETLLRSTVAALLNSDGEPDPAIHDLAPDRPGRGNRERLRQIPPAWRQGRDDPGARRELRAALYRASPEAAGGAVVGMLQRQLSPQAVWEVMFDMAAEILMQQPGIVAVHAQTTANALHYVYKACDDAPTQQLALLQCAAFIAMFREMTRAAPAADLSRLEPLPLEHPGVDPLEDIFADLAAGRRLPATRKTLGYLTRGGDTDRLIAQLRHHLVRAGEEAHDYKLAEAVFESEAQSADPQWRARFLSAGMAYFKGPVRQPVPVVAEAMQRLSV